MTDEEKDDSWKMGLKIKAEYSAQCGEVLDLIPLNTAIHSGLWNSVNKEIIKLSTIVLKVNRGCNCEQGREEKSGL
jgi:hypothetical protein